MKKLEVWMRGPVIGVPGILQPSAHALMQTNEECTFFMENFDQNKLWIKPVGLASVGFHLQHIVGVIDRMLTYAQQKPLNDQQLNYLKNEGIENAKLSIQELLRNLNEQVEIAIAYLRTVDVNTLEEVRGIGKKKISTTLAGLLLHAAEHSQRHAGQLYVTSRFLMNTPYCISQDI